jgi:thymidylate kinase
VVSELSNSPQLPVSYSESELVRERPAEINAALVPDVNSSLIMVFSELDNSGYPWVLLRGEADLVRPEGDVDLLISPELLPGLDGLLAGVGYRRVIALGHGSHRFYFRYVPDEDLWIKLDIVSDISFGQFQELNTDLASGCLQRRVARGPLWLPEARDQAWLQILHLVLDKGEIASARVEAARSAAALASAGDPVAAFLDRRLGDGTAGELLGLLQSGSFDKVPARAATLKREWTGNRVPPWLIRTASKAQRRVGPRLKGRGPVIGALAPDGAGKTTLLHGLRSGCPLPSAYVYMGLWSSTPQDKWLQKIRGGFLVRKVFRILRAGLAARYHSLRGRVVLMDRLAFDALLPSAQAKGRLGAVTDAFALRFQPRPDLVLVLDAPGELMFARKGEHSPQILEEWRNAYLELAEDISSSYVLDAGQSASLVRVKATGLLWNVVAHTTADEDADAEPLPLHLWMLLDWRFLLPAVHLGNLGYGGRLSDEVVQAIHLLDPAAGRIEPSSGPAPTKEFDVVLLSDPDEGLFGSAVASLRPGGWMCLQVRRSFRVGSGPHSLAGWKRAMARQGFDDVSVYWHVPTLERPARFVPTSSRTAVRDTLAHYSGVRFGKTKAAIGRLALSLGLFNVAAAEGTVVGRRAPEASQQEMA